MNNDLIQSLWNRGKAKEPKMSAQQIESILQKSVKRAWTDLRRLVWFYLAVMAAVLVFNGMNIAVYRSNPAWLGAHVALTLLVLGFLGFGVHLIGEMRRLDNPAEGLAVLVRRQLRFFRTQYQVWLGVVTLGIWLLGFAVSLYMYQQDGHYRIQPDWFLAVFVVAQLLITYVIVRVAHYPISRRILAALRDVEAQAAEQTRSFEKSQKYRVLMYALAFILGVALFIGLLLHYLAGK